MTPVFIYALNCPVTGVVRYCGQTVDPDVRLSAHISTAPKETYHCARWVSSLLSKKLRPVMEILDVVPDNESDFWEREYIQNFRERGFDLTNVTPGGEGFSGGANHPMFGKPSHNLGRVSWNKGLSTPPEVRAKLRAAKLGTTLSPEHAAAIGVAHKGMKRPAGTGAKISAAKLGKKHKPETIAKMCAAQQARQQKKRGL